MNYFLSISFSDGLCAVLLGAAGTILIVMIAEAVCMSAPRKSKKKQPPAGASATPVQPQTVEPAAACGAVEKTDCEIIVTDVQPTERVAAKPAGNVCAERAEQIAAKRKGAYDKSFKARLIMSDADTKTYYSGIKNQLLKSGFQSRFCWRYESFRSAKKLAARLAIRGGGLCIFCALKSDDFAPFPPVAEDLSDKKSYRTTPLLCAVKNGYGQQVSIQLIELLSEKFGTQKVVAEECDFAALLPKEDFETLIKMGLIKAKFYRKKNKTEPPETAFEKQVKPVRKPQPERRGKRVKKVVNLDVIFNSFQEGENAAPDEIKKRIFGNNENITYIKVLGRGKADKKLTVTANAFSRAAQKNILDAGGKVVIKKR